MEKITQIDLLVHPFFNHMPDLAEPDIAKPYCGGYYKDKQATLLFNIWKSGIDDAETDKSRAFIYVTGASKKNFGKKDYHDDLRLRLDLELYQYAEKKLKKRLFLFYVVIQLQCLAEIKKQIEPEKTKVVVRGEWITVCCMDAARVLSNNLGIPRKNFEFLPRESVDFPDRYLCPWEIEEIKKLPKEKREKIKSYLRRRMGEYLRHLRMFRMGF